MSSQILRSTAQQVMGPDNMSSSTSTIKLLNLPHLKDDGTNYILYKEQIPNVAISKGLR
ncbi:uncharacterized protein BT62DRAFT_1046565 [Guyanagaster necrorhizus]|uniref:Uncharacterized protein n=1 Tax=Guyanagaster necrorhizus TaxID=856835 RepID=A0A9P7VI78_9AGAR|nr:uncharacterized protein BT62DRAFT_1046565 [Guyanagaster necrorhizus MCA 3950]KAG7441174.1 hypothetical protein BT62DRAFT_1046565 [Guyanagaster necrorhizus MCA 3950]